LSLARDSKTPRLQMWRLGEYMKDALIAPGVTMAVDRHFAGLSGAQREVLGTVLTHAASDLCDRATAHVAAPERLLPRAQGRSTPLRRC